MMTHTATKYAVIRSVTPYGAETADLVRIGRRTDAVTDAEYLRRMVCGRVISARICRSLAEAQYQLTQAQMMIAAARSVTM